MVTKPISPLNSISKVATIAYRKSLDLFGYETTGIWEHTPLRNEVKDHLRLINLGKKLEIDKYDIKLVNNRELTKCLYVTKKFTLKLPNNSVYTIDELSERGTKLITSSLVTWSNKIENSDSTNLNFKKMLKTDPRFVAVMTRNCCIKAKEISNIARISTPESKIRIKVRDFYDYKSFSSIIGYLYLTNNEGKVIELVENNITKPIIKKLLNL